MHNTKVLFFIVLTSKMTKPKLQNLILAIVLALR